MNIINRQTISSILSNNITERGYLMEFCDFCRHMSIDTRRIKSYKNKKGYVQLCKACESERGLENTPTYEVSDLVNFCEQRMVDPIAPTIIQTDNGGEYLLFHNGRLQFLKRDELKLIADEIYRTLGLDFWLDEFIAENNRNKKLEEFYSYSEKDKDKFQIPYAHLRLSKKKFNHNKNKWSFKCGNCSELINIDVQDSYYTIVPQHTFTADDERGCSKGCTEVIIKDIIKDWVHSSDIGKYFYVDDIDQDVIDLINES